MGPLKSPGNQAARRLPPFATRQSNLKARTGSVDGGATETGRTSPTSNRSLPGSPFPLGTPTEATALGSSSNNNRGNNSNNSRAFGDAAASSSTSAAKEMKFPPLPAFRKIPRKADLTGTATINSDSSPSFGGGQGEGNIISSGSSTSRPGLPDSGKTTGTKTLHTGINASSDAPRRASGSGSGSVHDPAATLPVAGPSSGFSGKSMSTINTADYNDDDASTNDAPPATTETTPASTVNSNNKKRRARPSRSKKRKVATSTSSNNKLASKSANATPATSSSPVVSTVGLTSSVMSRDNSNGSRTSTRSMPTRTTRASKRKYIEESTESESPSSEDEPTSSSWVQHNNDNATGTNVSGKSVANNKSADDTNNDIGPSAASAAAGDATSKTTSPPNETGGAVSTANETRSRQPSLQSASGLSIRIKPSSGRATSSSSTAAEAAVEATQPSRPAASASKTQQPPPPTRRTRRRIEESADEKSLSPVPSIAPSLGNSDMILEDTDEEENNVEEAAEDDNVEKQEPKSRDPAKGEVASDDEDNAAQSIKEGSASSGSSVSIPLASASRTARPPYTEAAAAVEGAIESDNVQAKKKEPLTDGEQEIEDEADDEKTLMQSRAQSLASTMDGDEPLSAVLTRRSAAAANDAIKAKLENDDEDDDEPPLSAAASLSGSAVPRSASSDAGDALATAPIWREATVSAYDGEANDEISTGALTTAMPTPTDEAMELDLPTTLSGASRLIAPTRKRRGRPPKKRFPVDAPAIAPSTARSEADPATRDLSSIAADGESATVKERLQMTLERERQLIAEGTHPLLLEALEDYETIRRKKMKVLDTMLEAKESANQKSLQATEKSLWEQWQDGKCAIFYQLMMSYRRKERQASFEKIFLEADLVDQTGLLGSVTTKWWPKEGGKRPYVLPATIEPIIKVPVEAVPAPKGRTRSSNKPLVEAGEALIVPFNSSLQGIHGLSTDEITTDLEIMGLSSRKLEENWFHVYAEPETASTKVEEEEVMSPEPATPYESIPAPMPQPYPVPAHYPYPPAYGYPPPPGWVDPHYYPIDSMAPPYMQPYPMHAPPPAQHQSHPPYGERHPDFNFPSEAQARDSRGRAPPEPAFSFPKGHRAERADRSQSGQRTSSASYGGNTRADAILIDDEPTPKGTHPHHADQALRHPMHATPETAHRPYPSDKTSERMRGLSEHAIQKEREYQQRTMEKIEMNKRPRGLSDAANRQQSRLSEERRGREHDLHRSQLDAGTGEHYRSNSREYSRVPGAAGSPPQRHPVSPARQHRNDPRYDQYYSAPREESRHWSPEDAERQYLAEREATRSRTASRTVYDDRMHEEIPRGRAPEYFVDPWGRPTDPYYGNPYHYPPPTHEYAHDPRRPPPHHHHHTQHHHETAYPPHYHGQPVDDPYYAYYNRAYPPETSERGDRAPPGKTSHSQPRQGAAW